MLIACALPDQSGADVVERVNLATNKVEQIYTTPVRNVQRTYGIAGGALWIQVQNGSGCILPCTNFSHVFRIDLGSGEATVHLVEDAW
jgi:hypothetical protein